MEDSTLPPKVSIAAIHFEEFKGLALLSKKSFVDIEGKPSPGVYEYLVLAASTSSLKTVVKGTTVTVKEP